MTILSSADLPSHISTRLEDIPCEGSRTEPLHDLEGEMADVVGREEFAGLVRSHLLPFFGEGLTRFPGREGRSDAPLRFDIGSVGERSP